MANPIGKVARLFNPNLVKMEGRVEFLNQQLMSLVAHNQNPLKFGIGARGARFEPKDPQPSLTVDLGRDFPIDSLFLVPLQGDFSKGGSLFPKRFSIEF